MKLILLFILILNLNACSGNYIIHKCKFDVDFKNLDQIKYNPELEENTIKDLTLDNIDKFTLIRKCEFEIGDLFFYDRPNRKENQINQDH